MARPRKFYVAYGEHGSRSCVVEGLDALKRLTGRNIGTAFRSQLSAEEHAAWRDYQHGPDKPWIRLTGAATAATRVPTRTQ